MTSLDQQPACTSTTSLERPVHRRRLLDELDEAIAHGSAVLTAPAGFGKSILLEQWTAEADGRPIARVTLHRRDDARQVVGRLAAALQRARATDAPDAPPVPRGNVHQLGDRFRTSVLAHLEWAGDSVVVIDGLDAPADLQLVEALEALVGLAPPHVRFAIARRSQWPTGQHHASSPGRALRQIGEDDLAFRPEEARRLIQVVADRSLTDEQIHALMARTRGWPVALQVAASALRRVADVDALVRTFGRDDPDLRGYLDEEVISRQTATVVDFLTRTSVLDEVSGSLCDELTGRRDGSALLGDLARRGLFTRCVRPGEDWFAYHPLFRDRLRHELRRARPGAEAGYLGRAARWHVARSDHDAAARSLIEAGDWRQLVAVIDRAGRPSFEAGTISRLSHWLDAVPGSRRPGRNELLIRHAYVDTFLGDTHRAEQSLRDLDRPALSPGQEVVTEGVRAMWAWWGAPAQPAISHAEAALEQLATLDPAALPDILGLTSSTSLELIVRGSRARALWHVGEVAASRRSLLPLIERCDAYPPWSAQLRGALALLEAWAGNLRAAEEQARRALGIAARARLPGHPATLDARLALAHVARERALLDRANAHLADVETIVAHNPQPVERAINALERALGYLAAGHPERGTAEIDRSRTTGDPPPPPLVARRRRAAEVRLLVARGDAARARTLVRADAGSGTIDLAVAAAQAAVAQGDLVAARADLERATTTGAEPRDLLEHRVWRAVVDLRHGDRRQALAQASAIVADAEPEGYHRLFLDGGPPVHQLLRELLRSAPTAYLHRLVRSATPARRSSNGGERRELSSRELEVIRYLPTPLSSSEIAAHLYIAVTTLKTHLRSIYRKLGVTGRRDAAARAQELGLA